MTPDDEFPTPTPPGHFTQPVETGYTYSGSSVGPPTQYGPRATTVQTKDALVQQAKDIEKEKNEENKRFKVREIVRDQSRKIIRWQLMISIGWMILLNNVIHWIYTHTSADERVISVLGANGDKIFFGFAYVLPNLVFAIVPLYIFSTNWFRRKIPGWIDTWTEEIVEKEGLDDDDNEGGISAMIKWNRDHAIY